MKNGKMPKASMRGPEYFSGLKMNSFKDGRRLGGRPSVLL